MLLALLIVLLTSLLLVMWLCRENETDRLLTSVPGPERVPVFGNICQYLGLTQAEVFVKMRGFAATYGDRYMLKVFNRRILNVVNPSDAELILSSSRNINKSFIYSFLSTWLHEGLLLSDGEKWHHRRHVLTPAFHFNILKEFAAIIEENSRRLVTEIATECERDSTDVVPLVSKFALHSICETAMGTQLDEDKSKAAQEYKKAIAEMGPMLVKRVTKFWQHSDWIYRRTADGRRYEKLLETINRFPDKVIEDRRKSRKETKTSKGFEEDKDRYTGKKKRMAMLDLLLDAEERNEIDVAGIKEEVNTFMFEGHDTTAVAIAHALMLFANHQDIQERAYQEICDTEGGTDGLNIARYLEACVKETLRLYPSVPFISRVLTEDIQLNDITVKAGTTCHVHIFDMHRRSDVFPRADLFDPDRFLAQDRDRHVYAYIPFSAGPRNCIGQRFAMMEMKTVLGSVLKSFRLEPVTRPEDVAFNVDLVLRPVGPICVKFTSRQ